mmetsp:Transcript_45095/g.84329  ORF Transcript_45095/g.84329 Transcript_45095/m.84329 type:complete len:205 (+) Transcript_45095:621-1235(+)
MVHHSPLSVGTTIAMRASLKAGTRVQRSIVNEVNKRPNGMEPWIVSRMVCANHQQATATTTKSDPRPPSAACRVGLSRSHFQDQTKARPPTSRASTRQSKCCSHVALTMRVPPGSWSRRMQPPLAGRENAKSFVPKTLSLSTTCVHGFVVQSSQRYSAIFKPLGGHSCNKNSQKPRGGTSVHLAVNGTKAVSVLPDAERRRRIL